MRKMANIVACTVIAAAFFLSASHKMSDMGVRAQDAQPDATAEATAATPSSSDAETARPHTGRPYDRSTTIDIAGSSVDLCTDRHLCSSLGCRFQPSDFPSSSSVASLCQCDRLCTTFDDCCVDYGETCVTLSGADGERSTSASPQGSGLTFTDFTCYFRSFEQHDGYYVISSCPRDHPAVNDHDRQRCERGDSDDFLTGLPVLGAKNDVPYSNVYCALCWQEATSDLEPWSLTFECPFEYLRDQALRLLSNSTSGHTLETIRDDLGCALQQEPPQCAGSSLRQCHHDLTAECPAGHPLAPACASYTALSVTDSNMTLYKNPHCFLCNEEDAVLETTCSAAYPTLVTSHDPPSPPIPAPPGPIELPPISIVFDFRSGGSVKVVSQNKVVVREVSVACPTHEVYDPFLSSCRRLSCAPGYALEGGRCVRTLATRHGQDTVAYIHVSACTETAPSTDFAEGVASCLVAIANVSRSQFQPSTMKSALPTPGRDYCPWRLRRRLVLAFMVQLDRESFLGLRRRLRATGGQTFCPQRLRPTANTSVEVIYHDASLALAGCTGRWESASADGLPFDGNPAVRRETLRQREPSGVLALSSSDVLICANPDLSCPLETFNRSLFHPARDGDDVLVYLPTEAAFSRDEYIETADGSIQVCSFNEQNGTRNVTRTFAFFRYSLPQQILSLLASIASMLAALVTFITFCAFKELKNRTSGPIMHFAASLLLAQLLLLLSRVATRSPAVCTSVALLAHYFLLVSVLWTGVLAFMLNRTFSVWSVQRGRAGISLRSVSFAWGAPFLVTLPCLVLHLCRCTELPLWYGNEHVCWVGNGHVNIAVVGVPVGVVVLTNVVLFTLTACGIRKTKRETRSVLGDKPEVQQVKEELVIYIKIASLMGFTWIFGFAAAISDVVALWYVFILLNASQGVHIFLSFVGNKKVWRLWRKTFRSRCCSGGYVKAGGGPRDASSNTKTLEPNTGTTNV